MRPSLRGWIYVGGSGAVPVTCPSLIGMGVGGGGGRGRERGLGSHGRERAFLTEGLA